MPRRTKLNKELIRQVYDLTKEGHYIEDICEYLDISNDAYYNWINKGEAFNDMDDEEQQEYLSKLDTRTRKNTLLYSEFQDTVKKASVEAKMQALKNIRKAGKKSWQAEAWFLERKYRHQFGRVQMVEDANGQNAEQNGTLSKLIAGVDAIAQADEEGEGENE